MSGTVILILRLLLALSLYGFLTWALVLLWRDLKRQSEGMSALAAPEITFYNDQGEDIYRSVKPEILIGRDPAHHITIQDKTVSTLHARLSYHHHHWWLEDLDSTNGTFLNEQPVTSPVVVVSRDEVRCGQITFAIAIEGEQEEDLEA